MFSPAFLTACGEKDADSGEPADTDTDTDTDTDVEPDTAWMITVFEGSADITPNTWIGDESLIAYDLDGAEYCRITNPTSGVPSASACPECSYIFDITWGAGSMSGPNCPGTLFAADAYDGAVYTYGFAPEFEYYGYAYTNVLVYAYGDYVFPYFYAYPNGDGSHIDYRSIYPYYTYYFLGL